MVAPSASYWQRDAGWADRWHDVAIPPAVDVAVLGGRLAGLTTAIRLRERAPSSSIVVLEAERVGFGASGRNAGFLSPRAAPAWLLGAERAPDQAWAAARINAYVHAVARWLAATIPTAELAPARLRLAATSRLADGAVAEMARAVDLAGLPHALDDTGAHRGHLALAMDAYTMYPYAGVRGLAEHAVRLGVIVRERARVRAVEAATTGARVRLDGGADVTARQVVICTNGYTPSLDVGEPAGARVVHSFMIASSPLAQATLDALAQGDVFTVEVKRGPALPPPPPRSPDLRRDRHAPRTRRR